MPESVKLSSKHQIVVPREAREALNLKPGDRLIVTARDDAVIEIEKEPADVMADLKGLFAALGPQAWSELGE
ncbi:MAG: AbrB/MazE/SpoVT family DNA-binding domain-containing protein [Gemmatimonadota bacterium]|jgi:AbrB family looped-hinge helix DNA binding protein|nr:MAG: AbrB/MazE/SpoVT family DNA-binding domain-containing protein [Gemmatimonadota bacterium]